MAPFLKSLSTVRPQSTGSAPRNNDGDLTSENDQKFTLEAWVDEEWSVGVVPNGGYLIGLVLQGCSVIQAETGQREPLYLSAQYLGSSTAGPCIIIIERIKSGRSYSNLTATLSQSGRINIHCQLIYGTINVARHPFGPFPSSRSLLTLAHPHPLSRRCPLATHPSKCSVTPFRRPYAFTKHLIQAIDLHYVSLLDQRGNGFAVPTPADLGGGGSTWGGWYQFTDKGDTITPQMLPFLADVVPELLPDSLSAARGPMWFPTLALSTDFKHRVPSSADPIPGIAPQTVGIFAAVRFLIEGRYEVMSEIWTAPSAIGTGIEEEGWQDKMFCMASVTQTALTVPASVNFNKASRKGKPSMVKL